MLKNLEMACCIDTEISSCIDPFLTNCHVRKKKKSITHAYLKLAGPKGMRAIYQKRAKRSNERIKLWIFTPHLSKFRTFRTLHPSKQHVFFKYLVENKAYSLSKRALRVDTARNKWLKKP